MCTIALSLAVMSALQFAGVLVGSEPFKPERAGTSEAVICVALVIGSASLLTRRPQRRLLATIAVLIAIVGFALGLTFTTRGGGAVDIAYHATVLPLLLVMLGALVIRRSPHDRGEPRSAGA
jgi:peptidoglycan/LPS O-acetylase OafA/YrhL